MVADYTERLARSLDVDQRPVVSGLRPLMPRVRDLRQPVTETSIDLLDFLSIGDCELQSLIAERNSALGRVATSSARLVHDLKFLQLAAECLETLSEDDAKLAELITDVMVTKRQELPGVIFSATIGGEDFRAFWRADAELVVDAEVIGALRALNSNVERWLNGDYAVDPEQLALQLRSIHQGQGGEYLQYWFDLARYLSVADEIIEARLIRAPLCFPDMKPEQAEIFHRVVMQFFIGGVQKEVAILSRGSFDLFAEVDTLESQLSEVLPPAYRSWQKQRREVIAAGSASMNTHVQSLEAPLDQCGWLPG